LDAVGFGSLNLDEFWETPSSLLRTYGLKPGEEYVRDADWFISFYPKLISEGKKLAVDPGGSAANMIAALRRMGFETGYYGAAGKNDVDSLRLHELGPPEHLQIIRTDMPTGRCLSLVDPEDLSRDRALVILPNANDLAGSSLLELDFFRAADWIHITSFVSDSPLSAQVWTAHNLPQTTSISFDPGVIYCSKGISALNPILRKTRLLFITEEELQLLTGSPEIPIATQCLFEIGVDTLIIKLGPRGLRIEGNDGSYGVPAVPPKHVCDRTGAGDVAAAGFLAGTLLKASKRLSLEFAATAASRSIEGYGRTAYPDRNFLESFFGIR
jgi:ribokinase